MLTRLRVDGFKNLVDVDVRLGPFTCIAGPNASGKSNLFDAIAFLSQLADRTLIDAAASIRAESGRNSDPRDLFHRVGDDHAPRMRFVAEMIIPSHGTDDLGQAAAASTTFLEYTLELRYRPDAQRGTSELEITHEELNRIKIGEATRRVLFPHGTKWRSSVLQGRRQNALISTSETGGKTIIRVHQDQRSGRTKELLAERLPRTALSSSSAAETPTALLARREMQAWRELQLEPGSLREPNDFRAPTSLASDGANLASTVASLTDYYEARSPGGGENFLSQLANRLALLVEDVSRIDIDRDIRRELITLFVTDRSGTRYPARALSDGTLRFLALSVMEADPRFGGVLCLEEPENGIHPDRISSMLDLLRDLAVDPDEPCSGDNPLRQVIINTHSPALVRQIRDDQLLVAAPVVASDNGSYATQARFRWLGSTWRHLAEPKVPTVSRGLLMSYLGTYSYATGSTAERRVMDHPDGQQLMFPALAD